jgi:hypothetical protein
MAAVAATLILAIAGCNDDGGNGFDGGASTPSSAAAAVDVEGATADLRELLGTTPEKIASNVSALGLTPVTADQVDDVAATLCGSAFDPEITTSWLQSLIVTNVAMMGPANRLLRYSGTPEMCPREPTAAERDFYVSEVYRVLEPRFPRACRPPSATSWTPVVPMTPWARRWTASWTWRPGAPSTPRSSSPTPSRPQARAAIGGCPRRSRP